MLAAGRGAGRGGRAAGAGAAPKPAPSSIRVGAAVSTPYGPGVVESVGVSEGGSPLLVVAMTGFGAKGYLQADQVTAAVPK